MEYGITTTSVDFEGKQYTVKIDHRDSYGSKRRPDTKTRVFISGAPSPPWSPYTTKKSDHEAYKARERYNKEKIKIQRRFIESVLDPITTLNLYFSRFAGCSCPCSPGWQGEGTYQGVFYLTVKLAE